MAGSILADVRGHCELVRRARPEAIGRTGAAMKVVQELLGHATIEMTMRYALTIQIHVV